MFLTCSYLFPGALAPSVSHPLPAPNVPPPPQQSSHFLPTTLQNPNHSIRIPSSTPNHAVRVVTKRKSTTSSLTTMKLHSMRPTPKGSSCTSRQLLIAENHGPTVKQRHRTTPTPNIGSRRFRPSSSLSKIMAHGRSYHDQRENVPFPANGFGV